MKYGTYAQKLSDGRYEYGRLKENLRCLGTYYGMMSGDYSEWQVSPPTRIPYGVVDSYELARGWMTILEIG
jgi:hypothetical protein